jgi:hypothetical protein
MAIREGIELIELYGMQETRPDPNKFHLLTITR